MNEYDSDRIYDLVSTIGFKKTDIKSDADCYILNTCHIREKATEKVYHEIGRVKKTFRNLKKTSSYCFRLCCSSRVQRNVKSGTIY